jgi:hypothetical protein
MGGGPVRHLSAAMPETISAADLLCHSGCSPDDRRAAGDLMQALAAVECLVTLGGPAELPDALLQDLVIITLGLAGRDQSEVSTDHAAGGTGLPGVRQSQSLPEQSPPLPELDQFLASALNSRFHLAPAQIPVPA